METRQRLTMMQDSNNFVQLVWFLFFWTRRSFNFPVIRWLACVQELFASSDLANYNPASGKPLVFFLTKLLLVVVATTKLPLAEVARQFAKEREIFVYFVSLNIPADRESLFTLIGGSGFWNMANAQFHNLAFNIRNSHTGEYLFGYCSPSCIDGVTSRYV